MSHLTDQMIKHLQDIEIERDELRAALEANMRSMSREMSKRELVAMSVARSFISKALENSQSTVITDMRMQDIALSAIRMTDILLEELAK